jgi:MFS transporter, NNP family, nitrate/nitrite transporter
VATITAIVERKDWGKALSLHGSAPPLSLTIGPLLIVLLLNYFAWQFIIAIIGIVAILTSFVFLRYFPCGGFPGESPNLKVIHTIFGHRSVWILMALFSVNFVGSMGIYAMLSLYLTTEIGFSIDLANTLLGLSAISGLFVTFLSGILMDRIGEKKQIAGVMLLGGITVILLGISSGWLTIVVIFIQPAIQSCFPAAGMSAIARSVPPNLRSITTSLVAPVAFLLGGGFGPVLIGYMGEIFSFRVGFVLIGCLLLITPGLLSFIQLKDVIEEGC